MIIIDTNVISEFFKAELDIQISLWLNQQKLFDLYISTPTIMELWSGVYRLPQGRKRKSLEDKIQHHAEVVFVGRILDLNAKAAKISGELYAKQISTGYQPTVIDCQIAAIAIHNGYKVATRNAKHFHHAGLEVINPWEK